MYYRYFDPTMILLVPAMIISFYAQSKINSTYNKFSREKNRNGYSGMQVARMILDGAGLFDVPIEMVNSRLGDHYDPSSRVLRLSPDVYNNCSIAAAGVAAHEVGHAIQHAESYAPIKLRNAIVPVANISSNFSWILFFIGIIAGIRPLTILGILLFCGVVAFQLITLPVEFDASARALRILKSRSILFEDEVKKAGKVLKAAAMTYVAATLMAISQLLRLIAISNNRDD